MYISGRHKHHTRLRNIHKYFFMAERHNANKFYFHLSYDISVHEDYILRSHWHIGWKGKILHKLINCSWMLSKPIFPPKNPVAAKAFHIPYHHFIDKCLPKPVKLDVVSRQIHWKWNNKVYMSISLCLKHFLEQWKSRYFEITYFDVSE